MTINFVDQLNNKVHENWFSMNIYETTALFTPPYLIFDGHGHF